MPTRQEIQQLHQPSTRSSRRVDDAPAEEKKNQSRKKVTTANKPRTKWEMRPFEHQTREGNRRYQPPGKYRWGGTRQTQAAKFRRRLVKKAGFRETGGLDFF